MKKILSIALTTCNLCFANVFDFEECDWKAEQEQEQRFQDVDLYMRLIYDEDTDNKQKVELLLALSRLYYRNGQPERSEDALRWLKFLCWIDKDCLKEVDLFQAI